MGADMGLDQIRLVSLLAGGVDLSGETNVLLNAVAQLAAAKVAVGGFEAGHPAQPDFEEGVAQLAQGARGIVGRRMVIDNRRAAATYGLHSADQPAVVERLFVQRPVKAPPQVFQRGDKVRTGGDIGLNPPGKAGIKVIVRADHAGHHQLPAHLFHLRLRIALAQAGADSENFIILNGDIDVLPHFRRIDLRGGGIFQDQDTHTSTPPRR